MFSSESELMPVKHQTYKNQDTSSIVRLDETERFEQTYPLNANGRVNVSNVNGSITVEAWDRNEVRLEAVKIADSRESLADVEIRIDARQDRFSVEADYDNAQQRNRGEWKNHRRLEVQFRLSVPRTAVLDEIETVNGSVTVSDFVNFTKVSAVNGGVKAMNLRGNASLSTVNGTVDAVFERLEPGSRISLNTVNGRVNLLIPSDSNATVKADTLNGQITNDFGLPVRKGEYVGRDLYGKIGTGDVQIKLNSVNGGLAIGRKQDGKTPNPATNLLPQKNADQDDDDWSGNGVNSAKINKEIGKEVAKASVKQKELEKAAEKQKETAKSVKKAEKEFEVIVPEIEKIAVEAVEKSMETLSEAAVVVDSAKLKEKLKETEKLKMESLGRVAEVYYAAALPAVEKNTETFAVKGAPKVSVDAKNCAVTVRGWDKQEVQYVVKKYSRSRNRTPVDIKTSHTDTAVNLRVANAESAARGLNFFDEGADVRVEVYVPKKSNLKITTNGEIRLEGVSGDIELNGADEAINVRDSSGKLIIASADGRVRVVGFSGELTAKTGDGETYLEGDFEKITASTADGSIIVTVSEQANAEIESNLEDIEVEGLALQQISENPNKYRWKLGKGGANFNLFTTDEGKISLRSKNSLLAKK
jgi:hypothetical protein